MHKVTYSPNNTCPLGDGYAFYHVVIDTVLYDTGIYKRRICLSPGLKVSF